MRDVLIIVLVLTAALIALRRPWVGALLWAWLSLMNPHRYAFGFAYEAPLAAIAAGTTIMGLLMSKERRSPFRTPVGTMLVVLVTWITISWLAGVDPSDDYDQWKKVMKVLAMTLVTMALIIRREQVIALVWVVALSLGLLGAKGGLFTILTGGGFRVWGPPGTFIEDNNEFALALVMTIPLLRFLQQRCVQRWQKHLMGLTMVLCAAAALGSHSRGALIAIGAMALMLWWRSQRRLVSGIVLSVVGLMLVAFMPEEWIARMSTIQTYDEDASALGRINAWWCAFNVALDRPTGIGFTLWRPEIFAQYAPVPSDIHAAHSIYFLVLGNHGFIGLAIFLLVFVFMWRQTAQIRLLAARQKEWKWCDDLAAMCQVSLIGYAIGGAFLSLSYFDLPYYLVVFVSSTLLWIREKNSVEMSAKVSKALDEGATTRVAS